MDTKTEYVQIDKNLIIAIMNYLLSKTCNEERKFLMLLDECIKAGKKEVEK